LQKAVSFNGDVSTFDTSKVVRMDSMFNGATLFNQPAVSRWNVSKCTSFAETFKDALSFNQNLSQWNVTSVRLLCFGIVPSLCSRHVLSTSLTHAHAAAIALVHAPHRPPR
jgi:Mycoplasma protein of unknown function, DUF285